jgi:hypothetical protein
MPLLLTITVPFAGLLSGSHAPLAALHVKPSPVKPELHVQSNVPEHVAFGSHADASAACMHPVVASAPVPGAHVSVEHSALSAHTASSNV